jgi:hypothetical protein
MVIVCERTGCEGCYKNKIKEQARNLIVGSNGRCYFTLILATGIGVQWVFTDANK